MFEPSRLHIRGNVLSCTTHGYAKYSVSPVQRYANLESSHHKFTGLVTKANEIYALWQVGDINLLGFLMDNACRQGLTHQVADAVCFGL